ncbi:hypothetical protein GCM10011335_45950 [Aureimonas glaciei]|uniref:Uncharacterized protein n=1 Tax=Aureimonas glaciei TaxID=1776957 RepID=A0A917DGE1_9HYPH|nr:hypothetical protein GCM10011335_45950 [Aureimonas glaciei]
MTTPLAIPSYIAIKGADEIGDVTTELLHTWDTILVGWRVSPARPKRKRRLRADPTSCWRAPTGSSRTPSLACGLRELRPD